MKAIYKNDATWEETAHEVEEIDASRYRPGLRAFRLLDQGVHVSAHDLDLNVFDDSLVADGRCGRLGLLTDAQYDVLVEAEHARRAVRRLDPLPLTGIAPGTCWECGRTWNNKGECPHCGADPL